MLQKTKPIRLSPAAYKQLEAATIQADGYKCGNRYCWSLDKRTPGVLKAHHIIYRSQGGSDIIENLITLCPQCHRKAHDGCNHPRTGVRMTGREYMRFILDAYLGTDRFRWHNAYGSLSRVASTRASTAGGAEQAPPNIEGGHDGR